MCMGDVGFQCATHGGFDGGQQGTACWWSSVTLGSPIAPCTLQFPSVFPFPLLSTELCGYPQLKGLASTSSLLPQRLHCWHTALQLTEGCPESTGHGKAQGTTKPLLDTHGLVKPQTVMKDETLWQLLKDTHRNQVTSSHSWLEFFLWAGRKSISSWAAGGFCSLSSLVVDYRKSGSVTRLHTICHAEFADEQISSHRYSLILHLFEHFSWYPKTLLSKKRFYQNQYN